MVLALRTTTVIAFAFTIVLLSSFHTTTVNCQTPMHPLISSQAVRIQTLVELFNLTDLYPNSTYYCTEPPLGPYFTCFQSDNSSLSYISSIKLIGNGEVIPPDTIKSLFFSNLAYLYLENVITPPTFLEDVLTFTNYVTCINCSIQSFPLIGPQSLSTLALINNPISGMINLSNFFTLVNVTIYNTDPSFLRDSQVFTSSSLPSLTYMTVQTNSIGFNILNLPIIREITIYFGPNFDVNSITDKFNSDVNLAQITFKDLFPAPAKTYLFPNINNINCTTQIQLDNINFQGVSVPLDFSQLPRLRALVINDSPLLDDSVYPTGLSKMISVIINNCGLKGFPVNLDEYSLLGNFNIANNSITAQPPVRTRQLQKDDGPVDFSHNFVTGQLDPSWCFYSANMNNNQLSGPLPNCYICHLLRDPAIANNIKGNSFSNYPIQTGQNTSCDYQIIEPVSYIEGDAVIELKVVNGGWKPGFTSPYCRQLSVLIPNYSYSCSVNSTFQVLIGQNGYVPITFTDTNQTANITVKLLPPKITGVIQYVYTGGTSQGFGFIINGYGFFNPTNLVITIGGKTCYPTDVRTENIACVVTDSMSEGNYIANLKFRGYDISYSFQFVRMYPVVTAVTSPPRVGGIFTVYGQFGNNFTDAQLFLNDAASPITSITTNYIVSNVGAGSGTKNLSVIIEGIQASYRNVFVYMEDIVPCPNNCNGHGTCDYSFNLCYCDAGWGGMACSYESGYNSSFSQYLNNGTLIQNGNTKFGFRVAGIREMNYLGEVVREWNINNQWNISTKYLDNIWMYRVTFESSMTLTYFVEEFQQTTNRTFANIPMYLDKGTLKMTVNITNWPYLSSTNNIQLLVESYSTSGNINCIGSDGGGKITTNSTSTSLEYIMIERNGKTLYGRFLDRVLSDGKPTFSQTLVVNQTNESLFVAINLPYGRELLVDPDFSVIISGPDGDDGSQDECNPVENEDDSRKWVIVSVSVVVSVVGASLIVLAVVVLKKNTIVSFRGGFRVVFRKGNSRSSESKLKKRSHDGI